MSVPDFGLHGLFARFAFAISCLALLASCSGSVSPAPGAPGPAGPIVITPAEATLYSDLPTNFVITGGNGEYIITSSDQAVIPVAGAFTGNVLTIVPRPVAADTPVTITVRDTGTAAAASAALTVRPRTISNVVTITPSSSQSAACGTAVCSGGDAEVRVTLTQNGVPIVGREVRFEVISGDVRIITSPAGLPETLSTSGSTTTDATGTARMRIRVLADATSQTALLQVTDTASGFTQRTAVTIAPASNAPLNAQPSSISFVGREPNTCASGIAADVIVFGGRPPYLISQPGSFQVTPIVVTASGGRFTVTATGQCTPGSQIAVVDGNGATVSVTASNALSNVPAPTPPAPPTPTAFSASPTTVSLGSCSDVANVLLIGGSGNYVAASGSGAVLASVSGSTGSIQRNDGGGPGASIVRVTFSDGQDTQQVTVGLSGEALGTCPAPPPSGPPPLVANPSSVTLTDCTTNQSFRVSGGGPSLFGYSEIPNGNSFTYSIVPASDGSRTYFVRRRDGPAPSPSPQQSLTVSDGTQQVTVPINFSGAAAGTCP